MGIEADDGVITWKLHFNSEPGRVFKMLATNEGRARFWAEFAIEQDWKIEFRFPDGSAHSATIVEKVDPTKFALTYIGGSLVTFEMADDGQGGCDLTLTDRGVPSADQAETAAGWVSILMALKAAVDMGFDIRNHDQERTWAQGFVDN